MSGKLALDERRRLVAESLQVGNPGNNARDLPTQADPRVECQIELAVTDIRPYEHNPRRAGNAKFDDIKESIRTSGLRSPLTVTRRPGETHFIVEAGGNTRLVALQQLWAETRDQRFRTLAALFRPWRSESHVLTSHLIENEQRGEMTFWDKAAGVVALKARLEAEQGRALSLRLLEDAIHAQGLAVNTSTLAHYLFATERLRTLGEAVSDLSGLDVKTMQPRLNALKRLAHARASTNEEELYATVFEPVFRRIADRYPHTRAFTVAGTCEACEEALARHLGEPVATLREALRPVRARGGQVAATVSRADTQSGGDTQGNPPDGDRNRAAQTGRDPSEDQAVAGLGPDLLEHIRSFAESAGLGDCVRPEPTSPAGYRISAPPSAEPSLPERGRAWWLLAVIGGQIDSHDQAPSALDSRFIDWLIDPTDASAAAFWRVLSHLRHVRGAGDAPAAAHDPMSDPGQA